MPGGGSGMHLQDGFIVGIFNYCDRWCETCPFTSRCRVFAGMAEGEAALDPQTTAVVGPRWMRELIDGINQAAKAPLPDGEWQRLRRTIASEHAPIRARADAYCEEVHLWLRATGFHAIRDLSDPRAVIRWFHTIIPPKVVRALKGLAHRFPEDADWPADPEGSAKVALLGIDRSHAAFLQLVERNVASDSEVQPLLAHLVWLGLAVERVFPNARTFVRPAFDEPDEVARLYTVSGADAPDGLQGTARRLR
jgi:hypothetical protein